MAASWPRFPISYPHSAHCPGPPPTSCAPAQPAGATAFQQLSHSPTLAAPGPLGLQPLGIKDGSEEQAKFYTPDAAAGPEAWPCAAALHPGLVWPLRPLLSKAAKYDYTGMGRVAPNSSTLLEGHPAPASRTRQRPAQLEHDNAGQRRLLPATFAARR